MVDKAAGKYLGTILLGLQFLFCPVAVSVMQTHMAEQASRQYLGTIL